MDSSMDTDCIENSMACESSDTRELLMDSNVEMLPEGGRGERLGIGIGSMSEEPIFCAKLDCMPCPGWVLSADSALEGDDGMDWVPMIGMDAIMSEDAVSDCINGAVVVCVIAGEYDSMICPRIIGELGAEAGAGDTRRTEVGSGE
jgi:hypothetical protein